MSALPIANGSIGRDSRGRFAVGNAGGPCNPLARRVANLRSDMIDAIWDADMQIDCTAKKKQSLLCVGQSAAIMVSRAGDGLPAKGQWRNAAHTKPSNQLLCRGRSLDMATEEPITPPRRTQNLLRTAAVGCGVALLVVVGGKCVALIAARQAAIRDVQQEATERKAPTGLFGARWLMTQNQVVRVVPSARRESAENLYVSKAYLGRPATVTFRFKDNSLLLILVTFNGRSSEQDFVTTSKQLSAKYGRMPSASPASGVIQRSEKKIGRFVITHQLSDPLNLGVINEQVMFYRTK